VRALQTRLIYELARVFGFLSASATRAIKYGTGSIFVYSGILPRSFSSRKLPRRLDFQPRRPASLLVSSVPRPLRSAASLFLVLP